MRGPVRGICSRPSASTPLWGDRSHQATITFETGATAILTWSFFERRFNADPAILGKTIHLNSRTYCGNGVLPAWFQYPDSKIQLWVPSQVGESPVAVLSHYIHIGHVVARLTASASPSAALQEVSAVEYQLYTRYTERDRSSEAGRCKTAARRYRRRRADPAVCSAGSHNLSALDCLPQSLQSAGSALGGATPREMAIRSALGSSRLSLIRQQLTESLLISLSGGALGLVLSLGATEWLIRHWTELPSMGTMCILMCWQLGSHSALCCWLVFWRGCCRRSRRRAAPSWRRCRKTGRVIGASVGRASLRGGAVRQRRWRWRWCC